MFSSMTGKHIKPVILNTKWVFRMSSFSKPKAVVTDLKKDEREKERSESKQEHCSQKMRPYASLGIL